MKTLKAHITEAFVNEQASNSIMQYLSSHHNIENYRKFHYSLNSQKEYKALMSTIATIPDSEIIVVKSNGQPLKDALMSAKKEQSIIFWLKSYPDNWAKEVLLGINHDAFGNNSQIKAVTIGKNIVASEDDRNGRPAFKSLNALNDDWFDLAYIIKPEVLQKYI